MALVSSYISDQKKFDVFLSFKGEDSCVQFVSNLYDALCQKKIKVHMDDIKVEEGDGTSLTPLQAIQESKISVIIFSRNYAFSSHYLDEVEYILECKKRYGQIVLPVYYDIDSSHIRKQLKSYEATFAQLQEHFKDKMNKVHAWSAALMEVANISGWDFSLFRSESMLIDAIVEDIVKKLVDTSSVSDFEYIIGIDKSFKQIQPLLCIRSPDVRIIGIWGMGGIGKTTLASAIFRRLSSQFEGCCFLSNVREESQIHGLNYLRERLLTELLVEKNSNTSFHWDILRHRKVLIVLDDVDDPNQFEVLAEDRDCFGPGSRIIVTSRDVDVLRHNADFTYEVKCLESDEALQLFCSIAFKTKSPPIDFIEVSEKVVSYAAGVPLALKVLGGSLYSKPKKYWDAFLDETTKIPNEKIQRVLRISFDGLDDMEKDIFLDIACFFGTGEKTCINSVKRTLAGQYGSLVDIVILSLIDKSLITMKDDYITMHCLVQQMGFEIVRQESIMEPGNRSRLWSVDDVYDVFKHNTGTSRIQGISCTNTLGSTIGELHLSPTVFLNMDSLWLLHMPKDFTDLQFPQSLRHLPSSLRFIIWPHCPLICFPLSFEPCKLVELRMPYSKLEQLWEGVQRLENLKYIDLSHSECLTKIPDLDVAPNLESVDFSYCGSLLQVPSMRFRNCDKLSYEKCDHGECSSLGHLKLTGCSNLKMLAEILGNVRALHLSFTSIKELPSSIGSLDNLDYLDLSYCSFLENLPSSIQNLKSLTYLTLNHCSSFHKLPLLPRNIKTLDLSYTSMEQVPSSSIEHLSSLEYLYLNGCRRLESLPSSICKLKSLRYITLSDCSKLKYFPEILEPMEYLEILDLRGTGIHELPSSIEQLSKLIVLMICDCKNLIILPELPSSLEFFNASGCTSLVMISSSRTLLTEAWWKNSSSKRREFLYYGCLKLDQETCDNIVTEFQLRTLQTATMSVLKYGEQNSDYAGISICCPGNAIPDWFNFQSEGSTINFKFPSGWQNNFLGFALCAVVSNAGLDFDDSYVDLSCKFRLRTGSDEICTYYWSFHKDELYGNLLYTQSTVFGSDHVFMWHKHGNYQDCLHAVEALFSFEVLDSEEYHDFDTVSHRVIRCGIHLLYHQDDSIGDELKTSGTGTSNADSRQIVLSSTPLTSVNLPAIHMDDGFLSLLKSIDLMLTKNLLSDRDKLELLSIQYSSDFKDCSGFEDGTRCPPLPAPEERNDALLPASHMYNSFLYSLSKLTKNLLSDPNMLEGLSIQYSSDFKDFSGFEDGTRCPPLPAPEEHTDTIFSNFIKELINEGKLFEICFQYSRIPNWCTNWSSNSSIRHKLTQEDNFNSRKGIAVLFVFAIKDEEHDNFDKDWKSKDIFCNFQVDEYCLKNPIVLERSRNWGTGSFGICSYVPRQFFAGKLNKASSIIEASISTDIPNVELKACGMYLIYEQDVEELSTKLAQTVNEHRDQVLNFSRHCMQLLDGATKLESFGDIISLGSDAWKEGSSAMEQPHEAEQNCPAKDYLTSSVTQVHKSDFIIKLRRDVESWLSTLFQGNAIKNHFYFVIPLRLFLPWFFHHSVRDTSICYLPQNIFDDKKWVGLELYVIFKRRPTILHNNLDSDEVPSLLLIDLYAHGDTTIPILTYPLLIDDSYGSHFVLYHVPRDCFSEQLNQCRGISTLVRPSGPDLEVEMSGTRLLYEQDSDLLIQAIIESTQDRPNALSLLHRQAEMYIKAETSERDAAEREVPHYGLFYSVEREQIVSLQKLLTTTEDVAEEVYTLLQKYRFSLAHNKSDKEFDPILLHSKHWILDINDQDHIHEASGEGTSSDVAHDFSHLHVMIETLLAQGSDSRKWKRNLDFLLKELLKNRFLATISFKGHMISVLKYFDPCSTYNFSFPRKDILEWFKRQNNMSMVGIELPQDLSNDNHWRGIVLCASFCVNDDNEHPILLSDMPFNILCHLKAGGNCLNPVAAYNITKEKLKWLDHGFIWLTYLPRMLLRELNEKRYVVVRIYCERPGLIAKTCGIRLLFEQDVEEFKQTVVHCWTSFFDNLDSINQFVADEGDEELPDCDNKET